jgi:hypothetical protein
MRLRGAPRPPPNSTEHVIRLTPAPALPRAAAHWQSRASRPHALSTTLGIYGHQDQRDLERAMEAFAQSHADEDEGPL